MHLLYVVEAHCNSLLLKYTVTDTVYPGDDIYLYPDGFFWWIKMAWKISLEVQRLATFTLWICVFMTTVSFAPLSFDTQKFCIPSKLWPHGRTVEWWSKRTGPRCVGNQVAKCSGVSIWSHTSQKNHKKKKMLSLHVGVFAHVLLCV